MYMYPSTLMLAHSRVPHTFTYISFGYDMLTAARQVHRMYLGKLRSTMFPISPRTSLQQYYRCMKIVSHWCDQASTAG